MTNLHVVQHRSAALALSCAVLLSACSFADNGASPNSPDSSAAPAPSNPIETRARDLEPRSDLLNEHLIEWTKYDIVSADQLRIFFEGQNPQCYGFRAVVRETPSTVELSLLEGTLPEAPELCTASGVSGSIVVSLHDGLGTRSVTHAPDI